MNWLLAPFLIFGRYAVLCLVLFSIFYGWKRRAWLSRKIQQRFPARADYLREIGYSLVSALIFAGMAALWLGTPLRACTKWYTDIHLHGLPYLFLSVGIILAIHDTYFYWIHRLMHHPRVYRRIHLLHHRSVNPSPWAAYAFSPLEALLEASIIPLILLLTPVHPLAFFAFITIMLWFNVYGHLGYELFPKAVYTHPLGRWLNSAIYHNLHHERVNGNFGLYTTVWDRLMGTLREDSAARVEEVHGRVMRDEG